MFENLIAQASSELIASDILAGTFPQGALFSGPAFSGKLTAALETARVLSCAEGKGDWNCACPSCAAQRELNSPDTLIMGARSCSPEIRAAAASFLSSEPSPQLRYLLIRAVRKLTLRFHPVFSENADPKQAKAIPLLADINEAIEELSSINIDSNSNAEREELKKIVGKIADSACKIDESFLYSSLPVNAVRSASSWLHVKPAGKAKTLIIESADTMQDAARNALLKILEEPPQSVYFILTAGKKSAVMPTILSRVRNYPFVERSEKAQAEVLRRVFRVNPEERETVSSFVNDFLPVKPLQIEECARRFVFALLDSAGAPFKMPALRSSLAETAAGLSAISARELSSALNGFKPAAVWNLFLASLLKLIRRAARSSILTPAETEALRRWSSAIRQAHESVFVFNLSPAASLERLECELRVSAA